MEPRWRRECRQLLLRTSQRRQRGEVTGQDAVTGLNIDGCVGDVMKVFGGGARFYRSHFGLCSGAGRGLRRQVDFVLYRAPNELSR